MGRGETIEWIEASDPVRLPCGRTAQPPPDPEPEAETVLLPEDADHILEHIAAWAAGYDFGLKWNEEDKLKADMMNCPRLRLSVTVEQVRAKCRALKMRSKDFDTITRCLQRRKEGRRFIVRILYRNFWFH